MHDPIAYVYEAALHCPDCALERFGRDADGWITGADSEGNQIGVVSPWDETDPAGEYCDTCGEEIAAPHDDYDDRPTITDRDDLVRWVQDAWGDDDDPDTLPMRQEWAVEAIRDEAFERGVTWGDGRGWDRLLESLPEGPDGGWRAGRL